MSRSRIRKLVLASLSIATTLIVLWYLRSEVPLPTGRKISKIVVYKSKGTMEVYSGDDLLKTYKVAIGKNSIGDKEKEGDKRTPEGDYFIHAKNAESGYHKNLGISYPNSADVREARAKGFPTGGDIKIHGLRAISIRP